MFSLKLWYLFLILGCIDGFGFTWDKEFLSHQQIGP